MKKRNLNWLLALLAALALVFAGACSDGSDEAGTTETPSDDTSTGGNNDSENGGNGNGGNNDSESGTCQTCTGDTTCTVTTGCTANSSCTACATAGCECEDCGETLASYSVAGKTATYTADSLGSCTAGANTDAYALASVAIKFASDESDSTTLTVTYYHCYTTDHSNGSSVAWSNHTTTSYTYEGTCKGYTYTAGESGAADTVTVTLPADSNSNNEGATLTFSVDSNKNELTLTAALTSGNQTLETYTVTATTDIDDNGTHAGTHGIDLFGDTDNDSVTGGLTAASTGGSSFALNN